MSEKKRKSGFFEDALTALGAGSGAMFGFENGEWGGLLIGAVILGAIGKWVGRVADWVVKVIVLIVIVLLNGAVRVFIRDIITAVFDQML